MIPGNLPAISKPMEVDPVPEVQQTASQPGPSDAPVVDPNAPPPDACETIYIQNLNEKVKLEVLKTSLGHLFKHYGTVLNVTAHKNLRMRGQAFVSFESKEIAAKAVKEVKGFPLYAKPMSTRPRTDDSPTSNSLLRGRGQMLSSRNSTPTIYRPTWSSGNNERVCRPSLRATTSAHILLDTEKSRRDNPLAVRARAKRAAAQADGAAPSAAPKRPVVQMPDEYLPPNRVLFVQNLPIETITKEILQDLFGQYPNLLDIRTVPTKKDIAFIEYADEDSATTAKDALHNNKIDGESKIKITYARK
ncbi:hypothetical protein FRB99_004804 [Tulasnella sp. 403]|nr:hypothetical protein FRB99_004804 [Tulasnella sp. 403]